MFGFNEFGGRGIEGTVIREDQPSVLYWGVLAKSLDSSSRDYIYNLAHVSGTPYQKIFSYVAEYLNKNHGVTNSDIKNKKIELSGEYLRSIWRKFR